LLALQICSILLHILVSYSSNFKTVKKCCTWQGHTVYGSAFTL